MNYIILGAILGIGEQKKLIILIKLTSGYKR